MTFKPTRHSVRVLVAAAAMLAMIPAAAHAASQTLVVLGDSLSAGYGLAPGESFPEQLEAALRAEGRDATVVNAGVSGDTASDGLARLDWSVPRDADAVIVELGANDALRGIDPSVPRKAIGEIVRRLVERGQPVLLAGMMAPRNLGDHYAAAFDSIYPEVAEAENVPLYPFFLDGVAADPALNQPDGLHPTAEGVAIIVERILPDVQALLDRAAENGDPAGDG